MTDCCGQCGLPTGHQPCTPSDSRAEIERSLQRLAVARERDLRSPRPLTVDEAESATRAASRQRVWVGRAGRFKYEVRQSRRLIGVRRTRAGAFRLAANCALPDCRDEWLAAANDSLLTRRWLRKMRGASFHIGPR